jgi:hypothetical protein
MIAAAAAAAAAATAARADKDVRHTDLAHKLTARVYSSREGWMPHACMSSRILEVAPALSPLAGIPREPLADTALSSSCQITSDLGTQPDRRNLFCTTWSIHPTTAPRLR